MTEIINKWKHISFSFIGISDGTKTKALLGISSLNHNPNLVAYIFCSISEIIAFLKLQLWDE